MIIIKEKSKCCGCGACKQKCPQKCISMKEDNEGFLYPDINENDCIKCGLCEKVCPVINNIEKNIEKTPMAYAVYAKDSMIREESSSGGMFTLLAEKVLEKKGIIFGAAFDDKWQVKHIAIDDANKLYLLRGSKYLQSNTEDTFMQVKNALNKEKEVLFSGTECQIVALKKFLGKEYCNLITVGVLCHGVPSQKVWKKYLEFREKEVNSKVGNINFRNKRPGWKEYSLTIRFKNGEEYSEIFYQDLYMKMFLNNICLRPSCHACRFKELNRKSDITIGDFWGIEQIASEMDDNRGTSLVLVHSTKGMELLKSILNRVEIKEVDTNCSLPEEADSRHSVPIHRNREKFFKDIEKEDIDKLGKLLEDPINIKVKRRIKILLKHCYNIFR